jgi:outer membrane protein assembly factor BamB
MATLWTAAVDDPIEGALASDDKHVFVATRDGAIRALDRDTGAAAWKAEGAARRVVSARNGSLLARDLDGSVASLAPGDGAIRWTAATGVKGDLPALVTEEMVIVAGEGLAALDLATGHALWSAPQASVITAPPVLLGSCLAIGTADGSLRCLDPKTGVSRWSFRTRSALQAPPVADESGRLYLGTTDRRLLTLDAAKGNRHWRWKVGADVQFPPALAGDKVLVASFDAVLYALHTGNGNLAWRGVLPSRPLSAPLVTRGAAIVACQENEILGFDLKTGQRLGSLKTAEAMRTPPLLLGGRLVVGLRNRSVVALELPVGPAVPDDEGAAKDLTSEKH